MSHKQKVCETAAVAHIETCHPQCSYVPLVVSHRIFDHAVEATHGLAETIDREIDSALDDARKEIEVQSSALRTKFSESIASGDEKTQRKTDAALSWQAVSSTLVPDFERRLNEAAAQALETRRTALVQKTGAALNKLDAMRAIEARLPRRFEEIGATLAEPLAFEPIRFLQYKEVDQLGLFFTESVCYRCEALAYEPCGEESTILPGEKLSYTNTLTVTEKEAESTKETTSQVLTTKDSLEDQDTLESSYERKLKKETDIKSALEAGFTIPFKKIPIKIGFKDSADFNKIVEEAGKSSSKSTRTRFQQVERELKVSASIERNRSIESELNVSYQRVWENKTDKPLTYIRRQSWCKTSVIHKRTNVQIAWSGCIQNPGRDLCTPDNLEEKLAPSIKLIRDKWQKATPPAEFGPRPANQTHCTSEGQYSSLIGGRRSLSLAASVPSGFIYFGNPAIEITNNSTTVMPSGNSIDSAPGAGATGAISFNVTIELRNRIAHKETATVRVCFEISPLAAKDWDDRVAEWRKTESDEEVAALLKAKQAELEKFLASEQAHAAITRRVMEDYFSVDANKGCCELIKRLHKLFDFDRLCFTLYPTWNANGTGCQASRPPTIYTAKCLSFYLPINPGMEAEAFALLGAVGAIPWSTTLLGQYLAYAQQVDLMRSTLFDRAFDPTGWNEKFDQPMGYQVTPYDTTSEIQWDAAHETSLNYQVIDAFTITTPCGGFRIDPRPMLCG
jgi:hypothetical protein